VTRPTTSDRAGTRFGVEAGVIAGLAGLAVFLVLHHLWIVPIWGIAPVGLALAAGGGAVIGAAYGDLLPRLPRRPWRNLCVCAAVGAILVPPFVIAEAVGPVYAIGAGGNGTLLVSPAVVVIAFAGGLMVPSALSGAALGWLGGRTRTTAARGAVAGLALALGPGHNIPLLGGTSAAGKELAILAAVLGVASIVLVESQALLASSHGAPSDRRMRSRDLA